MTENKTPICPDCGESYEMTVVGAIHSCTKRNITERIPEGYKFHNTKPAIAVLKEGISKEKGDSIYADEIEYIVPPVMIYYKED